MREWIVSRPNEATKDMLRDAFCTGELIRCKDCRHFEADLNERTMYCANDMMPTVFVCTGQGFCSEAERKEE